MLRCRIVTRTDTLLLPTENGALRRWSDCSWCSVGISLILCSGIETCYTPILLCCCCHWNYLKLLRLTGEHCPFLPSVRIHLVRLYGSWVREKAARANAIEILAYRESYPDCTEWKRNFLMPDTSAVLACRTYTVHRPGELESEEWLVGQAETLLSATRRIPGRGRNRVT